MICLPTYFFPSNLLDCQDAPSYIQRLLEKTREHIEARSWTEAKRFAIEARDESAPHSHPVAHAMALIHLADIYRGVGRLGPTLECCERAQRLFKPLAGPAYYYNRAVCEYALGLAYHELGSDSHGLECYEAARQLFEDAHSCGPSQGRSKDQETGCHLSVWLDALMRSIIAQMGQPMDVPFSRLVWVPVFRGSESDEEESCEIVAVPGTVSTIQLDELLIDYSTYDIFLPNGQRPKMPLQVSLEEPVLAVEMEGEANSSDTPPATYGLVQVTDGRSSSTQEKWFPLGHSGLGDFERDRSGRVRFVSKKAHVIGGDLVGILRRRVEH